MNHFYMPVDQLWITYGQPVDHLWSTFEEPAPRAGFLKTVYKHNILGYFYLTTTKYSGDRRFDPLSELELNREVR